MIVKPVSRLVQELDARSFTFVGSPCSDGLGAEAMQLFHAALAGAGGDFIAVAGDVSPLGRDPYYSAVAAFIEQATPKPTHVLRGNHDGPDFGEFFGEANRAVLSEDFTLLMLDNSDRTFSDDTLTFMRETMAIMESRNVILAFHIPPPNRISGNTMTVDAWAKFEEAAGVWRNRISLIVCGHEHSYYEDDIDGIRLVVSGGGGSLPRRIERVNEPGYHALEIAVGEEGRPVVTARTLGAADAARGEEARSALFFAYQVQCNNHVGFMLRSGDAARTGQEALAYYFRAAARSSMLLARMLYRLLAGWNQDATSLIQGTLEDHPERGARPEAAHIPPDDIMASYALKAVDKVQKTYSVLLDRLLDGEAEGDGSEQRFYYLCNACGILSYACDAPNYCAECGAPAHLIGRIR